MSMAGRAGDCVDVELRFDGFVDGDIAADSLQAMCVWRSSPNTRPAEGLFCPPLRRGDKAEFIPLPS